MCMTVDSLTGRSQVRDLNLSSLHRLTFARHTQRAVLACRGVITTKKTWKTEESPRTRDVVDGRDGANHNYPLCHVSMMKLCG